MNGSLNAKGMIMMTNTKRAAKGGEFGANGEWYEGGKFINTVPENRKKEGSKPKGKPRKVQIEPYVWAFPPEGKTRALFSVVGGGAEYIDRRDPSKGIRPYAPAFSNGVMFNGETIEEVQSICDRYNSGERWR